MSQTPQVVESTHEVLLWMIPQLDKFPRNRRFTLGERIEQHLLEVLELLTEAAYSRQKGTTLSEANRKLAVVRHLWRLAYELKVVALKQYEYGGRLLVGVGQQVGGWHKQAGR